MRQFADRFRRNDAGATAIEYGLIVGLIFVAIIAALGAFGDAANAMFARIGDAITAAIG